MKALFLLSILLLYTSSLVSQDETADENGIIIMGGIDHLRPVKGGYYKDGIMLGIGTDSKQKFTAFQFRLTYHSLPLNKGEFIDALSDIMPPGWTPDKISGPGHQYITALLGVRLFYPSWYSRFQPYVAAHGGIYRWLGGTTTVSGHTEAGAFTGKFKSKGETNLSYRLGIGSEIHISTFKFFIEGGYLAVSSRGQDPEFTPLVIGMKF
ncbi:hypothetical protein JNM05_04235 [bacterium]|nr:hypothetical protein [bacterium]